MHNKQELDRRLKEAGAQPLKKLGQNFLLNPTICQRLVDATLTPKAETVVEIGPGVGALTDSLAEARAKHLVLIELDSGYSKYWATRLGVEPLQTSSPSLEAVQILHADALHVPWRDFEKLQGPRALVSNLPYSIAASLVVDLAESPVFDRMVLMFQKEVAERLMSEPGDPDYGMLSVVAQAAFKMAKLIDAGPQDFFPVPNVGSRVVVFERKPDEVLSFDRKKLLRLVKAAFAQRRKKIASNLAGYIPKAEMVLWLLAHGFTENARAEELSVAHYIELCGVKPLPPAESR